MIFRETKTHLTLSRYGGVVQGKNLEVRVCTLPVDTNPYAIPSDIIEVLTPRELKELQTRLVGNQTQIMTAKASSLVDGLHEITSALESDLLNHQSVVDLHRAATLLVKRSRRFVVKPSSNTGAVEST
jgi:hypothetical protein